MHNYSSILCRPDIHFPAIDVRHLPLEIDGNFRNILVLRSLPARLVREPLWGDERATIAPLFPELDAVQASPNILTSMVEHNDLKAAFGGSYFLAQKREDFSHGLDVLVPQSDRLISISMS